MYTRAVDGVSTHIGRAETLGLVGESGSGKTTLARVVAGLTAPTSGSVSLEGNPLRPETGRRAQRGPAPDADGLSEPGRLAQPAQDRRPGAHATSA